MAKLCSHHRHAVSRFVCAPTCSRTGGGRQAPCHDHVCFVGGRRGCWDGAEHGAGPGEAGSAAAATAGVRVRHGLRRHDLLLGADAAAAPLRGRGPPVQGGCGNPHCRLPGGDADRLAAQRAAHRQVRRPGGGAGRPRADERGDAGLRLGLGGRPARRSPARPGRRGRVYLDRRVVLAGDDRSGGAARRIARRRAGRGRLRCALRPCRRSDGGPGGHRAGVLRRLCGGGAPHAGRLHRAGPQGRRSAGTAGGTARAARPPGRHGNVADGAGRHRLRGGRRARAATAGPAGRVGNGDRGDVSVRGTGRVGALADRGAPVRPLRRAATALGLARRRRRVRRPDPADGGDALADRRAHSGHPVLRLALRPGVGTGQRGCERPAAQPGDRLRAIQSHLGRRPGHRRIGKRGAGPGYLRPHPVPAARDSVPGHAGRARAASTSGAARAWGDSRVRSG
jgi:hypothetical protein